jgi:hypothetical protein
MAVRRRGQVASQSKTACVLYAFEKSTGQLIGSSGFPAIDRINRNGKWGSVSDSCFKERNLALRVDFLTYLCI